MNREPPLLNENKNHESTQKSSLQKVQIEQSSRTIERTRSEPIPDESDQLVRTTSTVVHVDSTEFEEDRIKKELSISSNASKDNFKEDKSSEYDAPIIDISDAKV